MKYDYETIKILAKEKGVSVNELIALAPQNDPFYVGTQSDIEKAQWFFDILNRAGYTNAVHLRRVHYWTVSQTQIVIKPDGKPYENTDNCWSYLNNAAKYARYLGYVSISDIVDHKHPPPIINTRYNGKHIDYSVDIPEIEAPDVWTSGQAIADVQPYHLEVWCEKSTMNDVLEPVCKRFNANLATFEGEVSLTACYDLAQRIKQAGNKPTRVWYISDFDPAGNSMPVAMSRKTEWILKANGLPVDLKITPIVLTLEQVRQYQLPRTPIKKSERRAANFEDAFGSGGIELDALEALYPGKLSTIVSTAIEPYYSQRATDELYKEHKRLLRAIKARIDAITTKYVDEIEALKEMIQELKEISVDTSNYGIEQHTGDIDENGPWLFDSTRKYIKQLDYYARHKGKTS